MSGYSFRPESEFRNPTYESATKLAEAAAILGREDYALQLRYMQTLTEVSVGKTNTIVFPLPIDLFLPFLKKYAEKPSSRDV